MDLTSEAVGGTADVEVGVAEMTETGITHADVEVEFLSGDEGVVTFTVDNSTAPNPSKITFTKAATGEAVYGVHPVGKTGPVAAIVVTA